MVNFGVAYSDPLNAKIFNFFIRIINKVEENDK